MTTPNSKPGTIGQRPNRAAPVSMADVPFEGLHLRGPYWKDLSPLSSVTADRLRTRKPFIHAVSPLSPLVRSQNVDTPRPELRPACPRVACGMVNTGAGAYAWRAGWWLVHR